MEINKRSDEEMNMIGAFEDTVELARNRGCDVSHFVDMRSRITDDFSELWLGYMQGFIVALEVATLDEVKEVNKKHAYDDGRPFSTDKFIAGLNDRFDEGSIQEWEFVEAVIDWNYGDWNSALEYLSDDV